MKTILAALILAISGTAQARILVQNGNDLPQKLSVQRIAIGRMGEVSLVSGTESLGIPKKVIDSTGLSTKDFIELIERYNANPERSITLILRNNPDGSVGQMTISIAQ